MIIKGDYTWTDLKDTLKLNVPLKGVSINKVDIRVTESTIKINYKPYLIDLILSNKIDPIKHKATVKNGSLIVTLYKSNDQIIPWISLEHDIMNEKDKVKVNQMKSDAQIINDQLNKDLEIKHKDRLIEDERLSVRKQMAIDEMERNRLDSLKAEEKSVAEKEMYELFDKMEYNNKTNSNIINKSNELLNEFDIDKYIENDNIDDDEDDAKTLVDNPQSNQSNQFNQSINQYEPEVKYIPPPRSTTNPVNTIQFTPRVFPTPLRESKAAEEEDWVTKNRKHLKNHGLLGQNVKRGTGIDISEEDPIWLKAKGDDFYRTGDFKSAISAYTSAIEIDPLMISCYSNRSNCYYKLNLFNDSIYDCNHGINQIKSYYNITNDNKLYQNPQLSEIDRNIYTKLLIRKSISKCQLGLYQESFQDYMYLIYELTKPMNNELMLSMKNNTISNQLDYINIEMNLNNTDKQLNIFIINHLLTNNQTINLSDCLLLSTNITIDTLRNDISHIYKILQCDLLKKKADKYFSESQIDTAIDYYNKVLDIIPIHVSCLSNRSACYLTKKLYNECINDCSTALDILQTKLPTFDLNTSILSSILPINGSDKHKLWTIKTITRRGIAYKCLDRLVDACNDYKNACELDPINKDLNNDYKTLTNLFNTKQ